MKQGVLLICLLFLLATCLYVAVFSFGQIQKTNVGNCTYNSTGYLENCSSSNQQYDQQIASSTQALTYTTILGYLFWLIVACIIGSIIFTLTRRKK